MRKTKWLTSGFWTRALCLLVGGSVVLAIVMVTPNTACAQDENEGEGGNVVLRSFSAILSRLVHVFESNFTIDSWPFGVVFFLVSVALVVLIIILFMDLRLGTAIPVGFVEEFSKVVNARQFKQAFDMCRAEESFLGRVMTSGMGRLQFGIDDARQASGNMVESVRSGKDQTINYVATVATVAPLIGLFGTVWGMIGTFKEIEREGDPKPRVMAQKINVSLGTTFVGIMVAVPALFFNTFFRNRLRRIVMDTSNLADDLLTQMYHNTRKGGAAASGPPSGAPPPKSPPPGAAPPAATQTAPPPASAPQSVRAAPPPGQPQQKPPK